MLEFYNEVLSEVAGSLIEVFILMGIGFFFGYFHRKYKEEKKIIEDSENDI